MSGPIVRQYGVPNYDEIFGKKEPEKTKDNPESTKETPAKEDQPIRGNVVDQGTKPG
jgi:hypothetical protein